MKKISIVLIYFILIVFASCRKQTDKKETQVGQKEAFVREKVELKSDLITPEILWNLGRLSEVRISPDKKTLLFGVTYYNVKQNKGNRDLYTMNIDGTEIKQITKTDGGEYSAVWRPDGAKIAFLTTRCGSMQVWEMNTDGTGAVQVSNVEGGVSNFAYAPTMNKILYTADVKAEKSLADLHPDLPKADAKIYDRLMFRHWDTWEDEFFSHVFVANYDNGSMTEETDIMPNEPFDSPVKPWGGIEEITWSNNGKLIAYSCKKLSGKDYALSTNSEIYVYNTETKQTQNISQGNKGYDKVPVFSPDDKKIAWLSMERDGFEADKNRIMVYDSETNKREDYTQTFEHNAQDPQWAADGKSLYFISAVKATQQIFKLDTETRKAWQITKGTHDYIGFEIAENAIIGTKMSMSLPNEVFSIDEATGDETQITFTNKELLDKLAFGKVEERWVTTTDKKQMLVWVIYPPHFDKTKKYPAILYCQGGPQSTVSQFFSYRWNFQIMAANDYIIVAPNRRGLPSFGQEWNDQISKDYGGQNMLDYFSAIDEIKKEPYIDAERIGAVGASYGGFSVYWLAGNHQKRFKAFIAHCGIFNFESMYGSTEELFFTDWDMGGSYWNKQEKNSYNASPHLFVKNWDTPILVVHGGKDFRIPYTQAMNAFTAAQLMNVPSRFLYFPEENHWVLSPQNGILWQREYFAWLDKWLKK